MFIILFSDIFIYRVIFVSGKVLGKSCSNLPNECANSNADCIANKCTCGSNYYDTNGASEGGDCAASKNFYFSF